MGSRFALYTDDDRVYQYLHKWTCTLSRVPYTQDGKLVAVDLYFDRKSRGTVGRVLDGQLMMDLKNHQGKNKGLIPRANQKDIAKHSKEFVGA